MEKRDIIVIGTSAGGLSVMTRLFAGMSTGTTATVFVVMHISSGATSLLPRLLERAGWLPAFHPAEGDLIRPGHIHVAPPDHHLLVREDRVLIRRGPRENRTRPAIDPLFRSAAVAFGTRVTGIVLTGMLDDGTSGLRAIQRCGGLTVVQDPDEAEWPGMPANAIARNRIDHVVGLDAMPELLARLIAEPAPERLPVPADIVIEARIAEKEFTTMADDTKAVGSPTTLTCPECGGGLSKIADGPILRFRCQIGHAFSPDTMVETQTEAVETALWVALRTHEDRVEMFRHLAEHARKRGHERTAVGWDERGAEARSNAGLLRRVLSNAALKEGLEAKG
ncbi:chemotaxis protein CheB [Azospirillum doebereinerae]